MFESLSLTRKLGLAFAALFASLAVAGPASAQEAAENPNNQTCVGSITKGEAPADEPTLGTVDYQVGCSGKITGYILVSSHAIVEFETEVFGVDFAKREVVGSDFFSCSGDIPGFGLNCVGSTSWGWPANLTAPQHCSAHWSPPSAISSLPMTNPRSRAPGASMTRSACITCASSAARR